MQPSLACGARLRRVNGPVAPSTPTSALLGLLPPVRQIPLIVVTFVHPIRNAGKLVNALLVGHRSKVLRYSTTMRSVDKIEPRSKLFGLGVEVEDKLIILMMQSL